MTSNRVNNDPNFEQDQNSIVNEVSDYCFISDLPDSILNGIFYRLPIQSVSRCKCVCSSWNNFISEPSFSVNYRRNSPFTALLHQIHDSLAPLELLLIEVSEEGVCKRTPFNPKLPSWFREKQSLSLVGSCNGFLCLLIHRIVYLTNPVMGVSIALPECKRVANCDFGLYMFGFSPSINKFKVLRISFECLIESSLEKCEIITVGIDDTWRCLPITSFTGFFYFTDFLDYNGNFHWFCNDRTGSISTFDLMDESLGQIPTPPSLLPNYEQVKLVVFRDQLGIADSSALSGISIWKMREYGVVESWTKVVVLTISPPMEPGFIYPVPVAELPNGDVLVSCSSGCLLSYSIKHKEWSNVRVSNVGRLSSGYMLNYTPNFSSPSELIAERHHNAANVSQSRSQ